MIILILNDDGERIYLLSELINNPIGVSFTSKDKLIKCSLYKNHVFFGYGEIIASNEVKWISFKSAMLSSIKTNNSDFKEVCQLKLKCSITNHNKAISKTKTPQMISHVHNNNYNNSTINPSNKKSTQSMKHNYHNYKSNSISIKEALLSPINALNSKKNSSLAVPQVKKPLFKYSNKKTIKIPLKKQTKEKFGYSNKTCNESSYENNTLLTCDGNSTSNMNTTLKTVNGNHKRQLTDMKQSSKRDAPLLSSVKKSQYRRNYTNMSVGYSTTKKPTPASRSQDKVNSYTIRIEDQYDSIEASIIDQKFETNIGKDEMIIYQEKTLDNFSQCSSNDESVSFEAIYNQDNSNNNESLFDDLKEDFEIFYTNEYLNRISNNVIRLELELCIDKMCQLQNAYHHELNRELTHYFQGIEVFNMLSERYVLLKKAVNKLNEKRDKNMTKQELNTFIKNPKTIQNQQVIEINSKEVDIWKMLDLFDKAPKSDLKTIEIQKDKLINIFAEVIEKNKGQIGFNDEGLCDKLLLKHHKQINSCFTDNTNTNNIKQPDILLSTSVTNGKQIHSLPLSPDKNKKQRKSNHCHWKRKIK